MASLRWVLKIDLHQNFHSFLETMKNFETLSRFRQLTDEAVYEKL